jgi:lipopolysaccharide/colanic/teichoic acid biosynthesis glycosyltransferase
VTRWRDVSQRAFDLLIAGTLLLTTSPLWPIIYAAVRLDSPGPGLFRGRRMGRDGVEFSILKFRSMTDIPSGTGPAVTVGGDRRVTRLGRVLRLTKLDELPQLLNVLRGEMSMVGWRPEDPLYRDQYLPEMTEIFRYRPGMTSPASLEFRHEEAILSACGGDPEEVYVRDILPAKVAMDLAYCRQATLRSDVGVLVGTARAVASRRG